MKIVIPGRLPGLNEVNNTNRANKYAGNKLKKETEQLLCLYIKNQCKAKFECIKLSVDWYEPNMRRDYDNIASATKFILDALVKCEVIKNDGWKQIAPELYHRFFLDRDNPRIEIFIEEVQ
mgnify:CR=1 FL=1